MDGIWEEERESINRIKKYLFRTSHIVFLESRTGPFSRGICYGHLGQMYLIFLHLAGVDGRFVVNSIIAILAES
jgi:hypothetical protein